MGLLWVSGVSGVWRAGRGEALTQACVSSESRLGQGVSVFPWMHGGQDGVDEPWLAGSRARWSQAQVQAEAQPYILTRACLTRTSSRLRPPAGGPPEVQVRSAVSPAGGPAGGGGTHLSLFWGRWACGCLIRVQLYLV